MFLVQQVHICASELRVWVPRPLLGHRVGQQILLSAQKAAAKSLIYDEQEITIAMKQFKVLKMLFSNCSVCFLQQL